jgi:hypothetical protein
MLITCGFPAVLDQKSAGNMFPIDFLADFYFKLISLWVIII